MTFWGIILMIIVLVFGIYVQNKEYFETLFKIQNNSIPEKEQIKNDIANYVIVINEGIERYGYYSDPPWSEGGGLTLEQAQERNRKRVEDKRRDEGLNILCNKTSYTLEKVVILVEVTIREKYIPDSNIRPLKFNIEYFGVKGNQNIKINLAKEIEGITNKRIYELQASLDRVSISHIQCSALNID